MNKTLCFLIGVFFWTNIPAQQFEGILTIRSTFRPGERTHIFIGEEKALSQTQGAGLAEVKIIVDPLAKEEYVWVKENGKDIIQKRSFSHIDKAFYTVSGKVTDEVKTISGYSCKRVESEYKGQAMSLWLATDLTKLDPSHFLSPHNLSYGKWMQVEGLPGIVLQVEGKLAGGDSFTIIRSVEAKKIPATAFALPPGVEIKSQSTRD